MRHRLSFWIFFVGMVGGSLGCGPTAPERSGPPNILLVSLDTFRADRVGALGNPNGLTPNLDRFAAEAVTFTNAYSQSIVTGTSHASMFTSRYPTEVEGGARAPSIATSMYTLPEVLGAYGYQTAARVAGGDLNPAVASQRGFDTYESSVDFGSLWHTLPLALDWLDGADPEKPFFLFLHGYDAHPTYLKPTPYGLLFTGHTSLTESQQQTVGATGLVMDGLRHPNFHRLEFLSRSMLRPRTAEGRVALADPVANAARPLEVISQADQELIRDTYDGAVAYADLQFGLLLARLDARGRLDDTVVVVMGDHGEALGEDGLFHRCCALDDAVTHVPLLMRLPRGEGGGKRVDGMVQLIDIMPTLLEVAGATPPLGMAGVSLAPALRGEPFPGRRVAVSQANRMLSARDASGRLTYIGVQAPPNLLADIVAAARLPGPAFVATEGTDSSDQAALRQEMVRWVRTLSNPAVEAEVTATPPALLEKMRAQGYWDAQ